MITIRLAEKSDIPQLTILNNEWQYTADKRDETASGFLLNAVFSETDYHKMIDAQEIVVALAGDKLAGYYLIDNHSDTENLKHNQKLIQQLKALGAIKQTQRIGARAQAAVSIEYHNKGVSRQMFDVLKPHLAPKFDALFSTVATSNPKLIAHQKVGWQVVHQDDDWFYVLYSFDTN